MDLTEATFLKNEPKTIANPYPGYGVIVRKVKDNYFNHLNYLQKQSFFVKKEILEYLLDIAKGRTDENAKGWIYFIRFPNHVLLNVLLAQRVQQKLIFRKLAFMKMKVKKI